MFDLESANNAFEWYDYTVFALMLVVCLFIGFYFGFIKKSKNTKDYLLAGKQMRPFPVAASLVMSYISGVAFVGYPAEIYVYGVQYFYMYFGLFTAGLISYLIFVPVLCTSEIISVYEYLESRFDQKTRLFGSFLFILSTIFWLPIVIYVPAISLSQATGLDADFVTSIVSVICIFYTCIGGVKTVIWTDVVQYFLVVASVLSLVIIGTVKVGGVSEVWKYGVQSERIEWPDFSIDPTTRHTFWSLWIGATFYYIITAFIGQNVIQRFQSLPSIKEVVKTLWISVVGFLLFDLFLAYTGLLIYTAYRNCDPLTMKNISTKDQLLPYFALNVFSQVPGLCGLFLAGIFAASLSSLSSMLNCLAAVILKDFYEPFFGNSSILYQNIFMKVVVILCGVICLGFSFLVGKFGGITQLTITILAIPIGPALSLYVSGILLPWVNSKGAFYGGLIGLIATSWIIMGTELAVMEHKFNFPEKEVSISGCAKNYSDNFLLHPEPFLIEKNDIFVLYTISYQWHTCFSCIFTTIVSVLISFLTTFNKSSDINPLLLAPIVRKFISRKTISITK